MARSLKARLAAKAKKLEAKVAKQKQIADLKARIAKAQKTLSKNE